MAYVFKTYEKTVGSFIILGITALIFFIVFKYTHEEGKEKLYYYTYYKTGTELQSGMDILYKGIPIGKTTRKELLPEEGLALPIKLSFYIFPTYTNRVKLDSVAKFDQSLMPGGSTITITSGTITNDILLPGSKVISSDEEIGKKILKSNNIMPPQRIDQITVSLMKLANQLSDEDSPIMSLLTTVDNMLKNSSDDTSRITASLASIMEDINKDGSITDSLESLLQKLDEEGVLAVMDKDKTFMNKLNNTLENINELLENLQTVRILGGEKDRDKEDD
ncbi:MAG TPA: hypothetical protein VKS21_12665 [Spirochaetota bacterium]|nr:hypothetical protein [Spirochaetota bacterium]